MTRLHALTIAATQLPEHVFTLLTMLHVMITTNVLPIDALLLDANTLQLFVTTEMHVPLMSVTVKPDHVSTLQRSALQRMLAKRFTVITLKDALQPQETVTTTFHVPLILATLNSDASTSQAKALAMTRIHALKTDVS